MLTLGIMISQRRSLVYEWGLSINRVYIITESVVIIISFCQKPSYSKLGDTG